MSLGKRTKRAATLADVGREAGVSAMAASAVLNGAKTSTRISAETCERILEAAKKLNYRANIAARALGDRRMNTIGVAAVIESGEMNTYFLDVFNGILEQAKELGQNTTVFAIRNWDNDSDRLLSFCDGRIDGMILIAPDLDPERTEKLPEHTPFVAIHPNHEAPLMGRLECDDEQGAREIVRYLIQRGHRKILHLSGDKGIKATEMRLRGYKQALREAGLKSGAEWIVEAGFGMDCARKAMEAYLQNGRSTLPDAVFCASDAIAVGAMDALLDSGLRIPQDISIAGFDDSILARTTRPQLTTVRQPLRQMGKDSVKTLIEAIEQKESEEPSTRPTITYPTELILRASVCDRR